MLKLLVSLRIDSGHNRSRLAVKDARLNGCWIDADIHSTRYLFTAISALRATAFACSLKSLQFNRYFAAQTQTGRVKTRPVCKYPLAYRASTHAAHSSSHIKRSGLSCGEANLRTTPQIPGVSMQPSHATAGLPNPMRTMGYTDVKSSRSSPESSLSRSSMISRRSCNLPTPLM